MARALVGLTSFLARNILRSDDSFVVDEIEEEDSRHSIRCLIAFEIAENHCQRRRKHLLLGVK